jgi:hypothetical protein
VSGKDGSGRAALDIRPERVRRVLFSVIAALTVAGLAAAYVPEAPSRVLRTVRRFFDLDSEANIPVWWQTAQLLAASALLAVIARSSGSDAARWRILAVLFLAFSVDETSQLHEAVGNQLRRLLPTHGLLYCTWVIPGAAFVATVGISYWRFVWRLPALLRRRLLVAAAVYVGGALGVELFEGYVEERWGPGPLKAGLAILQETMEMFGIALFIHALLARLADEDRSLTLRFRNERDGERSAEA